MSHLKRVIALACAATAFPALAETYMDFGGMYGYHATGIHGNPSAGNTDGCPSGYTAYLTLGSPGLDYAAYWCGRSTTGGTTGMVDFGGMYGYGAAQNYNNPLTGGLSCPTGYTATLVLGSSGMDYAAYYCHKPGTANPQYRLGGLFGGNWTGLTVTHGSHPNPLLGVAACPASYNTLRVLGTQNLDYTIHACYRAMY
jgi:hypothetical protein